jgi:hypothetical protein
MSLDAVLARISQIESMLSPPAPTPVAATAAPAGTVGPSATSATLAPGATTGTMQTSFATALQGAMSTTPVSPVGGGSAAQQIVNIARSQIGQTEQPPGSNDSPAIAEYRTATQGAMAGEPWCAYFASWVARQAGEPLGAQGQGFGYVGDIWNWAQQTGRAITNGPGVVPSPGDLIVFGDHHVGIVDHVLPNGDIQTIEGNYSNQVSQVIRSPTEATGYVQM